MGEILDNVATFMIFGGAITLIVMGLVVAKPNLHGVNFVEGNCTITHATTLPNFDNLPTCNCGKSCSGEYPCPTVWVNFTSNTTGASFDNGTLHKDYHALVEECLLTPPDCSSKFTVNSEEIFFYYMTHISPLVNNDRRYPYLYGYNVTEVTYTNVSSFECWGYDEKVYFDHNYTAMKAYISLAVPSGVIVLGMLMTLIAGSEDQREMIGSILLLPIVAVGVVLSCITDIFGCDDCKCPCRRQPSQIARRRDREGAVDIEMNINSERTISDASRYTPRMRRRSLPHEASLASLDLERRRSHSFNHEPTPNYPSSMDPPSYTGENYDFVAAPVYNLSPILSGPRNPDPYSSTMNMPPPPSYNEAVNY